MALLLFRKDHIPWNKDSVKTFLWKPIMKLQLGKKSTTEMTSGDIDKVFDTLNRHLSQFGISEPFPSIETIMLNG